MSFSIKNGIAVMWFALKIILYLLADYRISNVFTRTAVGEMTAMAAELDSLNSSVDGEYVLIAAGRLGSSDKWLGIPCVWSQISNAHVIVETGLKEIQAEPSQGTHFFQNMTSLGCLYLTINPMYGDGIFDYGRISGLEHIAETRHFLHVRSRKPLVIKANGLRRMAVIKEQD